MIDVEVLQKMSGLNSSAQREIAGNLLAQANKKEKMEKATKFSSDFYDFGSFIAEEIALKIESLKLPLEDGVGLAKYKLNELARKCCGKNLDDIFAIQSAQEIQDIDFETPITIARVAKVQKIKNVKSGKKQHKLISAHRAELEEMVSRKGEIPSYSVLSRKHRILFNFMKEHHHCYVGLPMNKATATFFKGHEVLTLKTARKNVVAAELLAAKMGGLPRAGWFTMGNSGANFSPFRDQTARGICDSMRDYPELFKHIPSQK